MIVCPYCSNSAIIMSGAVLYPRRVDLRSRNFWICEPCDALVGCHVGTIKPFGILANKRLRAFRILAHKHFDKYRDLAGISRNEAYHWLADKLSISKTKCHIGLFDFGMCKLVISICRHTYNRIISH